MQDGKGGKSRILALPRKLRAEMARHLERVKLVHAGDVAQGQEGVYMPGALDARAPAWGKSLAWFWVFPAEGLSVDPRTGVTRRHHVHEVTVGRALRKASGLAKIHKKVTAHTLRHTVDSAPASRGLRPSGCSFLAVCLGSRQSPRLPRICC